MGYTHYWSYSEKFENPEKLSRVKKRERALQKARVVRDVNRIISSFLEKNVIKEDCDAASKRFEGISINGIGDNGHETFNPWKSGFCKTNQKTYDVVVVACLATIKYWLGDQFEVSSDGRAPDWDEGCKFASGILGRRISNPFVDPVLEAVEAVEEKEDKKVDEDNFNFMEELRKIA